MPFTSYICRTNNTQVDDAENIDAVIPMYHLIEYSDNYSKISRILWQYCRDEMALDDNGDITMNLVNCEINLDLNWPEICVIVATNVAVQATTFSITDRKRYVPVVTLSTQDNAKRLELLKSGFKRIMNWNKYQSKVSPQKINQYLDLTDPSFQGVNRLFVLPFENEVHRTSYNQYYLPTREVKNCVMIDGQNLFAHPVRND